MLWKPFVLAVSAVALIGLAGCEEDDDKDTSSSIAVLGVSGDLVEVEGEWFGCSEDGATYRSEYWTFDGNELTIQDSSGHPDPDCVDEPVDTSTPFVIEVEVVGEKDATWDDTTPAGLEDTVTASTFDYSGDEDGKAIAIVDDTGDTPVLHLGSEGPVDADGYPDELDSDGAEPL